MITALAIARRIASRAKTLSFVSYVPGPVGDEAGGFTVQIGIGGGRRFDARVTRILGEREFPVGFTHIFTDRKPTDQLDLADRVSRWVSGLSDVDTEVERMDPWHKDGVASLEVHSLSSMSRFLVEIQEWTPAMDIAAAQAFARTGQTVEANG